MNKRINIFIILLIIVIVICLFFVTATIAFITRSRTTNNIITFGNLKMELIQTGLDENGQEKNISNNDNLDITHNPIVSRIVKVKNLGKHSFFIRISLNIIGTDANKREFNANNLISYNLNTNDWIYKDGWYYYKKIVKENDITSNLMTQISFDINNITTNYPKGEFKLNINAEAVQAENNAEEVLNVVGWPSN